MDLVQRRSPPSSFVESVELNLAFWLQKSEIDSSSFIFRENEQSLLKALHYGFLIDDTFPLSIQLMNQIGHSFVYSLRPSDWIAIIELAINKSTLTGWENPLTHQRLLLQRAAFHQQSGNWSASQEALLVVRQLARKAASNTIELQALIELVKVFVATNRQEESHSTLISAFNLSKMSILNDALFCDLYLAAGIHKLTFESALRALPEFHLAKKAASSIEDPFRLAQTNMFLATCFMLLSRYRQAHKYFGWAASSLQQIPSLYDEIIKVDLLRAYAHYCLGSLPNALSAIDRANENNKNPQLGKSNRFFLENILGRVYLKLDNLERASAFLS